jgi:hypothetical protein
MWRVAVAITLGIALGGAVLAHTVVAQHPPASGPGQPHDHGLMVSHGADMESFIFAADEVGSRFGKALSAKARAGVEVRCHRMGARKFLVLSKAGAHCIGDHAGRSSLGPLVGCQLGAKNREARFRRAAGPGRRRGRAARARRR